MKRSLLTIPLALCASLSMTACLGGPGEDEGVAQTVAELQTVPAGVGCLRVVFRAPSAANDTTRSFAVTPGSPATLDLGYLAAGSYSFRANAYNAACGSVVNSTTPTWVGEPVALTLTPGFASRIAFTLRPHVTTAGTVDFVQPVRTIYGGKRSGTTFAVMQDGTVRAWGANSTGNLGDGTYTNAAVPRVVAGLTNPRQISAGRDYTCATTFNEGLSCWGRDIRQLIDTSLAVGPTPRANPDLEPDTVIAGDTSVCGRFNGYVQCWGFFLGPVPVPQAPSDPVMSFDTVDNFSSVSVLHVSAFGRLSRQNVTQYSDLSTRLRDRIVAVTAGANSYCAVTGAGTVVCAGSGADGHLGNGSLNNVLDESPTDTGLTQVTSVVAGDGGHYCALRTDRTVWCWGANIAGQTGAGIDGDAVLRPTQVPITDVVQITSGMYHSCALRGDGTVWCWGLDNDGQLGDGDALSAPRFTPVRVLF